VQLDIIAKHWNIKVLSCNNKNIVFVCIVNIIILCYKTKTSVSFTLRVGLSSYSKDTLIISHRLLLQLLSFKVLVFNS
jgi:hypothetical protein